jgi:hypothetical protein
MLSISSSIRSPLFIYITRYRSLEVNSREVRWTRRPEKPIRPNSWPRKCEFKKLAKYNCHWCRADWLAPKCSDFLNDGHACQGSSASQQDVLSLSSQCTYVAMNTDRTMPLAATLKRHCGHRTQRVCLWLTHIIMLNLGGCFRVSNAKFRSGCILLFFVSDSCSYIKDYGIRPQMLDHQNHFHWLTVYAVSLKSEAVTSHLFYLILLSANFIGETFFRQSWIVNRNGRYEIGFNIFLNIWLDRHRAVQLTIVSDPLT